jgi:hypothetical protein
VLDDLAPAEQPRGVVAAEGPVAVLGTARHLGLE